MPRRIYYRAGRPVAVQGGCGSGCGGCLTLFVFLAALGAIWTYVLTGNGRWVTLGLVAPLVAWHIVRRVRRRRKAKREAKSADIAKGAVWAARQGLLPQESEEGNAQGV